MTEDCREDDKDRLSERKPQCSINLEPMEEWIKKESIASCRPCVLPVTIDWYHQELTEKGYNDLVAKLDAARLSLDSVETCKVMDEIKDKVSIDSRHRLLEFDCATQEFSAEEEGSLTPQDEVSPAPSPPESHSPDSGSGILPEPLPPEPPEIGR